MRIAIVIGGNALAAAALWLLGLDAGKALGVIALFYVFLIPCGLLMTFFVSPYLGPVPAVLTAALLAAWLSWASVDDPHPAEDLPCTPAPGAKSC